MTSISASTSAQSYLPPNLSAYVKKESARLVKDKQQTPHPCYQQHFETSQIEINNTLISAAFEDDASALILGVGAAQDIDLRTLALFFKKVHLVDIDRSQTERFLRKQVPKDLRDKFEIEQADLTGIFPNFCETVEKLAGQDDLTYDAFVEQILDLLPTLQKTTFPYEKIKATFVCSSLVSTQLAGTLIGYLNKVTKEKYNKNFIPPESRSEEFDSFFASIIEDHLHKLSTLVSPSGKIYYADHFTTKTAFEVTHPNNPEIEDVLFKTKKEYLPFTKTLKEVIQKIFTIVSEKNWDWGLPISTYASSASVTDSNGTVIKTVPTQQTQFREYQISSYVLKLPEEAE